MADKTKHVGATNRGNNRPVGWEGVRFWFDTENFAHPVDPTVLDPNEIHGEIPAWVDERRGVEEPKVKQIGSGNQETFNLTDAGNAEYFTDINGDTLRFDHRRNRWLEWCGQYFRPENDGNIMRLALKVARARYQSAVDIVDLELRKKAANWAISSEQRSKLESCIAVAQNLKPIADSGEGWDRDDWLFCVGNGVIDLRTGEMRTGKPEDRITMQSAIIYDKAATCPLWQKFLSQTTGGNEDLKTYLQRAVGYSLTGETKAQLWFFLYGLGTNGKTTFTMTIRRMMGDYGIRIDSDDLMIKDKKFRGSSPKEGVADTQGKRYAIASEVQDGKKLDMGLLKDMTGQDTLKARRLYEHEVEFLPTHKLWMFGNHKPGITDSTNAAWRRLKLILFSFTVPDNEIDMDLQVKLDAELPGILNWAIKGCLEWQKEGLNQPDVVTDAVATYRHDSDILADFIEDSCTMEHLTTIAKSDLKDSYENWCKENGQDPVTQRTFKTRLTEKGVADFKGTGGKRHWRGIRLKSENDENSGKTLDLFKAKVARDNEMPKSPLRENENETLLGKSQSLATLATNATKKSEDYPDYPTEPCHICGGDYHLTDENRWLCDQCHPNPNKKE